MQHQLTAFFRRNVENYTEKKYVLAVSGGVDSMVLLNAMITLFGDDAKDRLVVAHVNYGLRAQAEDEEQLVHRFCKLHQIPIETKHWQEAEGVTASEKSLRDFRYDFFRAVTKKHEADYLVLAHHQDDQMETVLMKWSRGSTLEGLSGMKEKRFVKELDILRPFLSYEKKELYQEAKKYDIPYLEDESNESDDYTRNRYRHHVIPFLKEENPNAGSHFQKSAQMIADAVACLMPILEEKQEQLFQRGKKKVTFHREAFLKEPIEMQRLLLQQVLMQMDTTISVVQMEQILEKVGSDKAQLTLDLPNGWKFKKRYEECSFEKGRQKVVPNIEYILEKPEDTLIRPNEDEQILLTTGKTASEFTIPVYPKDFPLTIRHAKPGDKIALDSSETKHQKLSRWFINAKIPLEERKEIWVLEDASKKIRAILGYRYAKPLFFEEETGKMILSYENKTRCTHVKK